MNSVAKIPDQAALITIQPRMRNPVTLLPNALEGIQQLLGAMQRGGVAPAILELSHLRASQINGCSFCVEFGVKHARSAGETDERLFAVSAWRESPHFTGAERAALALTEAVTRLDDQADAVPDSVWEEAARHFDEQALAALVLSIGMTNFFNRINVSTRQPAGKQTW